MMESLETARRHFDEGRLSQAEAACRQILIAQPAHSGAMHLFGKILHRAGRPDLAVEAITESIRLEPRNADSHLDLGNALMGMGRMQEAAAAYRGAIAVRKGFAEAYANLGVALSLGNQFDEAIGTLREAIVLRPDFAEAHDGLGIALRASGEAEGAVISHRRAIEIRPEFAAAHCNLGLALQDVGLMDEAIAEFRRAMEISPAFRSAHSSLIYAMHFQVPSDPTAIYREHAAWNRLHAQPMTRLMQPHGDDADAQRRLRVGYVSPDFRHHAVSFFMEGLLGAHDHGQFEIFCYADLARADVTSSRIQKLVPNWRDITGRGDRDVCQLIRRDRIDILVDLAGHTGGSRLMVFAAKPVPVQVTYLGYVDTTGLDAMDYRLTDELADPPGMTERFHSERLVRLPGAFFCYRPPTAAPEVNALPALASRRVTFASFNTLDKINAPLLECWCEVLERTPGSRLMMMAKGLRYRGVRQRFADLFRRHGVEPERVTLADQQSFGEYLELHHRVDLILDSFPVNGHTVTCHGLWMGVPAVCLAGGTYCQRLGMSVMGNLGLDDLIAQTSREYVEIAVKLAGDLPRLAQLRAGMRDRMVKSSLMGAAALARNVEMAYREMWRKWCAGK